MKDYATQDFYKKTQTHTHAVRFIIPALILVGFILFLVWLSGVYLYSDVIGGLRI